MATELAGGIRWFDLGGVNAYLIDDGGNLTLVDAGMPWHAPQVARAAGVAPRPRRPRAGVRGGRHGARNAL